MENIPMAQQWFIPVLGVTTDLLVGMALSVTMVHGREPNLHVQVSLIVGQFIRCKIHFN